MTDLDEAGSPKLKLTADEERTLIAQYALAIIDWRWFPKLEVVRTRDQQLLIPPLLFGLYLAHKRGKRISKAEACDLMRVDRATTGPKFINALEADGLIAVRRFPKIDKRIDFLAPTKKLQRIVEVELTRLARALVPVSDQLRDFRLLAAIDVSEASSVPSGAPSSNGLIPIDWPPDHVGTSF